MSEHGEKHPSYVLVRFSNRTGNPGRLFGSSFDSHHSFITLEVASAELIREEGREDRYYGSMRGDRIEVNFSFNQFAELLSTRNTGLGVPGTLRYLNGQKIEPPPEVISEAERIRLDVQKQSKDFLAKFSKEVKEIRGILKDGKMLKGDRERIDRLLNHIEAEIASNLPFQLELFEEAMDKKTTAAKAEIDGFMTSLVQTLGLAALKENGSQPVYKLSSATSESSDAKDIGGSVEHERLDDLENGR